jgi:hypothetical protein
MRNPLTCAALVMSLASFGAVRTHAQIPAPAPRELTVEVAESLDRSAERVSTFAAIQKIYSRVLGRPGGPLKVTVERFASNNSDTDLELQVFFKGLYYETPGNLTLRAWVTLYDHGKEHDFGIIKVQLDQAPLDLHEDAFEHLVKEQAMIVAKKMEPILFPQTAIGAGRVR